jgi:AcrR family transcriptional regulator
MAQSATVRGPYAKTAKVRARAIDAGMELFGTAGYNGATLTEVADKLGMTLTGLQHHFPDKSSLLAAVLEERDVRAASSLDTHTHIDETESLLAMLEENASTPGLIELQCVLSAEATSPDHPAHTYFQNRYTALRDQATRSFEQMIESGDMKPLLAPSSLAAMVIALVDGLQLQWLLDKGSVDIAAEVRSFIRTFVPAIREADPA